MMDGCREAENADHGVIYAFPVRVLYLSHHPIQESPQWCEDVDSVDKQCRQSDPLSDHVQVREDTKHLFQDNAD